MPTTFKPRALRPENPRIREAGKEWRRIREQQLQMTLEDAEKLGQQRLGDAALGLMQISRIERGKYDHIRLDDAVNLGKLYGLTPNQVAEMYGLYQEPPEAKLRPQAIQEAEALAKTLPEDLRERLLQDIADFTALALARMRERSRTTAPAPVNA